jgi:nicotinate-nucleotide--dimethylbenzimidazole phosphoribosyltransferase
MSFNRPLVAPIANPMLQHALEQKIVRHSVVAGRLGELEPLAVRLGLIHNTLKPAFEAARIVVFAADHGLAVDGIGATVHRSTGQQVRALLSLQMPLAVFAELQGLAFSVVDSGVAEAVQPHPRLLARKIAHATRNARAGPAMSHEQAEAAVRAGMEIARSLPGNAIACAGIGVGSRESAALVLARLSGADVREFLGLYGQPSDAAAESLLAVLHAVQARHRDAIEPLAVLAAFGGFEVAMMVGAMLVAASERRLIIADGIPACAALLVASRIAPAVVDYCLHCRSHGDKGLDAALALFQATALLELGVETLDGTGATLAWPLLRSAAALLAEVADREDHEPGPQGAA